MECAVHRTMFRSAGGIRRLEGRAGYNDTAGALRDMVQNHIPSFFALLPMELLRPWIPKLSAMKAQGSARPESHQ